MLCYIVCLQQSTNLKRSGFKSRRSSPSLSIPQATSHATATMRGSELIKGGTRMRSNPSTRQEQKEQVKDEEYPDIESLGSGSIYDGSSDDNASKNNGNDYIDV